MSQITLEFKHYEKAKEIINAFQAGRTIQCKKGDSFWEDVSSKQTIGDLLEQCLRWPDYFRIKESPLKPKPFNNAIEFIEALQRHGGYIHHYTEPFTFIVPIKMDSEGIMAKVNCINTMFYDYESLSKNWYFKDGTPCAKSLT